MSSNTTSRVSALDTVTDTTVTDTTVTDTTVTDDDVVTMLVDDVSEAVTVSDTCPVSSWCNQLFS